jgi:hypothetical protein
MSERDREQAERERVAAESERVEAEEERVTNEGPPEAATERSRVEAEVGRVEAEEGRVKNDRRRLTPGQFYRRATLLIALPLAFIALIPSTVGVIALSHYAVRNCERAQANRDAIRRSLSTNLLVLGYRYDGTTNRPVRAGPPIAYYASHPDELEAVLAARVAAIQDFPAISCDPPFRVF